ncbi:MAG: hypothetical protein PGN16_03895 [Sphingomonas phyllosphaerae]|uniref:hypothetical protein n=1 Tax=Sphingomonas phyllosphaerae TaxID=257003 RepID=UPI002FF71667
MPLPSIQIMRDKAISEATFRGFIVFLAHAQSTVPQEAIKASLDAIFSNFPPLSDELSTALARNFPWWTAPENSYSRPPADAPNPSPMG